MAAKLIQLPSGASVGLAAVIICCMLVSNALFLHCAGRRDHTLATVNSARVALSEVVNSEANAEAMISEHVKNQAMMSDQVFKQMCVYTITTVTGKRFGAGTDSTISLRVYNNESQEVYFPNLDNAKNNFERGAADKFQETGNCVDHICKMILYTDNSGFMPAWFADSVGVSVTTPAAGVQTTTWQLQEWLPRKDSTAAFFDIRDNCIS